MSKMVRMIQFNELLLDRLRDYASKNGLTVDFVIAVAVDQFLDDADYHLDQWKGTGRRAPDVLCHRDRSITVRCPRCGAEPNEKCKDQDGNEAPGVLCHAARAEAWSREHYEVG